MVPQRSTRSGTLGVGALALAATVACSSGTSTGSNRSGVIGENGDDADVLPAGDDGATISCANDSRAEPYMPGMVQPGTAGLLTFTLVTASPAPPAVGDGNMWTLAVNDPSGQAVPNATFSLISTWMPDHGHGSPTPVVSMSNGDGTYAISSLNFFMPGLWQITFFAQLASASDAATATDSATFSFCVGG